jgi:ferredoxin
MSKKLILCDCLGSQQMDAEGLERATDMQCSRVYSSLCTTQIDSAARLIAAGETVIACQQERPRFEELARELEAEIAGFTDLRDRAGWSADSASKLPKMAALVAEANLPVRGELTGVRTLDVLSEGLCLIIGPGEVALEAAEQLRDILSVTVLLSDMSAPPVGASFEVIRGAMRQAQGALGGFELQLDRLQQIEPGGRGMPEFGPANDGAHTQCDIILDLSGASALFPAPEKREGYLRADPKHPAAVAKAVLAASQLTGTFEKPLYVRLEPALCAHSRAGQPACSNCLNACPTGAITTAGDFVSIDPMICAGCGACSSLCPSGAISYDVPPVETLLRRLRELADTYRKEAGSAPRLLVHNESHGREMISLSARMGRGLPADVISFEISALASFGHAEILATLGVGFAAVDVLVSPGTDRDTLQREAELAQAISARSIGLLELEDPDALSDALFDAEVPDAVDTPILPMGTRRQVTRTAAKALAAKDAILALPDSAPYGAVLVDTAACTLCLSCVSLCPSGALGDNPDAPQLRFQEDACLQCGLCVNICPEKAITLEPRLNLSDAAFNQVVLHEEEPFACIECGSLFGVKSTVEKITEKLAGKHAMFANPETAKMIQMCDNCRIQAQYHSQDNPFADGARPRVRTTDDYLSKRKDH